MRIILITGKGGVGKTTVAAATALKAADLGHRTLVMSTDPAHSLADAFQLPFGDHPVAVTDTLWAQQIDAQQRLEESWGALRDHIVDLFDWSGLKGVEAEELTVFPGMDEIFSLVTVRDHARSGDYDVIIVDCAPTAETLRLLSLPEVLSWYMEKLFPVGRKVARVVRPVINRVTAMPLIGDDRVFEAAAQFYERLDGVRDILSDPDVTTARLVMNPEKMVISEARRTYTYLGLFGYAVDAAIVNRVLPDSVTDPYFKRWREIQQEHLASVEEGFADVDIRTLRLFDEEMVGVENLRLVGEELYGGVGDGRRVDPTGRLAMGRPFRVEDEGEQVVLALGIPFAEKGDVDVLRHADELFITVGPYRRSFVLPDSLKRRQVRRARLVDGELRVTFGLEP
jgi:arsenite-transporting ATPase